MPRKCPIERAEYRKEYNKQWILDNPDYHKQYRSNPVNKAKKTEYNKQHYIVNKAKKTEYNKQHYIDNKAEKTEYNKQYRSDPVNKARKAEWGKQYYIDNKAEKTEYNKQYRSDPVNKARKAEWSKQWNKDNPIQSSIKQVRNRYGLTEEMYIKLYEEQGGLCLGCDIVLVTRIIGNEEDVIGIKGVDYEVAHVDHDHSFDIDGKLSGNPDSVRGLLCKSCNVKDVLNPESDHYIYGDDPTVKETLLKNREVNRILKQWHKEENS